jgi:hypothetical protein
MSEKPTLAAKHQRIGPAAIVPSASGCHRRGFEWSEEVVSEHHDVSATVREMVIDPTIVG